ncbi:MAG: ACT domain-containing protein [bacterium]
MPIEKQLSVFVQNKVGSLGDLCAGLSKANINIKALTVVDDLDWGIVKLIVDDTERAKETLHKLGLMFGESNVLTVDLENHSGAMAVLAETLSQKKINIENAYATALGDRCLVVLTTTDDKKAAQLLKERPGR